jgi:hypothetical protein
LVNFSRESEKGAKNSYGATRRNLFLKSKNQEDRLGTKSVTNPKGEVSKLNGKSPNSSRKSIKFFFWKLRNQYFILTSFIESKKREDMRQEVYKFIQTENDES